MTTTIDKANERIVSIQRDDVYDSLEDALGDGFIFRQGSRYYQNYEADFDCADYPDIDHWFVLDVYEHGGIAYSLAGEGHQCQFDTARGGAILGIPTWEGQGDVKEIARDILDGINSWANGEVYWYAIEDGHGNMLESCGGFVGRFDINYEVESALKHFGGTVTQLRDDAQWLLDL
jgi:hypothetical protein